MNSIFSKSRSRTAGSRNHRAENRQIEINGRSYPLRIRKLAQSRSIAVSADTIKGEVSLTMPRYGSIAQAVGFARSKADWLGAQFDRALPVVPLKNGSTLALFGEEHIVRWSSDFARSPVQENGEIRVGGPEDRLEGRLIRWMKKLARDAYTADVAYYCARAGLELPKLSVGDARRRWGSCSEKKSIRLSWRLIMAPESVRRSVVAHEVAHLKHMNHSKAFYGLLDEIFEGDRRAADGWLKRHGPGLHLIGASAR